MVCKAQDREGWGVCEGEFPKHKYQSSEAALSIDHDTDFLERTNWTSTYWRNAKINLKAHFITGILKDIPFEILGGSVG